MEVSAENEEHSKMERELSSQNLPNFHTQEISSN